MVFDQSNFAALPPLNPRTTPMPGERALQIGDKVEVVGEHEADWRDHDAWVAGIRVHDSGEGLDITIAEQWPIPNRHWRDYRGQTDGFRPEQLRRVAALESKDHSNAG
eukprot:c47291_g1_i1.p1 GENE.c47291_g1_i1~~c47291_g1_i1.p1  ORF type:complete len:108 (-),score=13.34 c47291_g1_i1:463-786(-)